MTEELQETLFEEQDVDEKEQDESIEDEKVKAKEKEAEEEEKVARPVVEIPDGYSSPEEYMKDVQEAFSKREYLKQLEDKARQEQQKAEYEQRKKTLESEDREWLERLKYIQQTEGPEAALLEMNRHAVDKAKREIQEAQYHQEAFRMQQAQIYDEIMADERAKPLHEFMPEIANTCIQNGWGLKEYITANAPFIKKLLSRGQTPADNVHNIDDARKKRLMDLSGPDKAGKERKKTSDEEFEEKLPDIAKWLATQ